MFLLSCLDVAICGICIVCWGLLGFVVAFFVIVLSLLFGFRVVCFLCFVACGMVFRLLGGYTFVG